MKTRLRSGSLPPLGVFCHTVLGWGPGWSISIAHLSQKTHSDSTWEKGFDSVAAQRSGVTADVRQDE
jgi:hypothetical protein